MLFLCGTYCTILQHSRLHNRLMTVTLQLHLSLSECLAKCTSACMLSNCVKLMFRLKDDSSISSLSERSSVLKECSSVTAWRRERGTSWEMYLLFRWVSKSGRDSLNLLVCIFPVCVTVIPHTRGHFPHPHTHEHLYQDFVCPNSIMT